METHFIFNFHLERKDHRTKNHNNEHEQKVLEIPIYTAIRTRTDFKFNHLSKGEEHWILISKYFAENLRKRQILKNQKDLNQNRHTGTNGIREYCGQYGLLEGKRR